MRTSHAGQGTFPTKRSAVASGAGGIVIDREFGQRMEEVFEKDERSTCPVTRERWEKRSLWQRFKEFGVRLFGYWI